MDFLPPSLQAHMPLAAIVLLVLCSLLTVILILIWFRFHDLKRENIRNRSLLRSAEEKNFDLQNQLTEKQIRLAELSTLLQSERKNSEEKLAVLENAEKNLSLQFQSLANQIFEEKSARFGNENKERVTSLLQPLQEQLRVFQKRIDDIQVNDVRERSSLKSEIEHLRELNQQINKEAVNLTRALRGDKKRQGNWGELVLERVLEKSGLRKGEEYSVQKGFRNQENQLLKPDVIIHLPDRKDIIIDSKVPLSAWERFISAEQNDEKKQLLKEHIGNIRKHVGELSAKNYSEIVGIRSLDFVLLFIPIDSSFAVAAEIDEELFGDAYEQRVIIVTPTTLLATLKTVENLWRYEHQNRNAREIADRAGSIYDKLRGFLEDMEKVGKQLATCESTFESAMNKLSRGKGNIISQAGRLTQLGVKAKKKIPRSIRDLSDPDIPN
jgi:DNA recombination protein RmuC